ncbi:MAG TPA: acyl-CoA dehydrogenase family protein, partial [Thermomicrobiales bacterium]
MSAEDRRLVERAKALAAEFAPRARAYDEAAAFPAEDFGRLRDEGFLTLTVPEELGGHGMWNGNRYLPYYTILETVAAGNASTAQLLQIQSHASGIVAYLGNEEQKRRILGDVVARGALIASCGSEADPRLMNSSTRRAEL